MAATGSRPLLRNIVVIGLAALVIGLTLPNAALPGPVGNNLPVSINDHYDVLSITPGSMADAAGLRVGDHIEPQSLSVFGRLAMQGWGLLRKGESITFTAERSGRSFAVELREPQGAATNTNLAILKRTTATLFIVAAMALLLLRPSMMLWGFFLYALGSAEGSTLILEWVSPLAADIGNTFLVTVVYGILGPVGLLIFATRFPAGSPSGLRPLVQKMTPFLAVLLALASTTFVLYVLGVQLPSGTDVVTNGLTVCTVTIGIIALLAGFAQLDAPQRQRLRWVVAGFSVFYAAVIYETIVAYLPSQGWPAAWSNAGWTSDVLNGFVIFIPITVAYAVLKHHVLDINFVIGRGIVYGILTSIAVAMFAVIEWLVGGVLAQTKLAAAGEVVAAVAIGFWLNGLHSRVDRFVDAVIFRRRHLAEQRLARVAAGLPHTGNYATIAKLVVHEPVEALGLCSAAFFRRSDDGTFRCEASVGIDLDGQTIEPDGELSVHLNGERGPVMLDHIGWKMPSAQTGIAAPVVALPVFVRHELRAIAFYGGHETGEAIDPDEMRALVALCAGAAAALDHTAAADLARRLEDNQRTMETLQRDIQTLRAQAAMS